LSVFKLHKKVRSKKLHDSGAFFEWATEKNLFFDEIDPWTKTQRFLVEIQKRLLAEQVFLVSRDNTSNKLKILKIAPNNTKSAIKAKLINKIMCKQEGANSLLFWEDIWDDPTLREDLNNSKINTLISSAINTQPNTTDHLFIVNYAISTDNQRINEYIYGLSAVLGQSIMNSRLNDKLQQKDVELNQWVSKVEERIEQGTKKLLEQEFQFHALFEGANDGIIVHNVDGDIIEVNSFVCKLLGYARNDLIKMSWRYIVPNSSHAQLQSIFKNVLTRKQNLPFEFSLRHKDTTLSEVEISSKRVWFRGEQVIQSFIRDISLRKRLQKTLIETKEKYKTMVESSLIGVFDLREDKILFVNNMFEQITGYSKEELLTMDFFTLISPEDEDRVREIEKPVFSESKDYETSIIRKDGRKILCEIHSTIITMDGQPTALGNIIDITQKNELANKLLEAKKMESIGTLAGGIAHDFNNLLGGILGYASLILSDMPEDNEFYEDISTIAETAKRAAVLTDRLLGFARGGKYQVRKISINSIVEDVISILAQSSISTDIYIETNLEADKWTIQGDQEQLNKAILNICLNAIEAVSSENGHLKIESANVSLNKKFTKQVLGLPAGDYIRLKITDNGYGMSDNVKSRMFEPFFTTKSFGEGVGLGLAMVYGVVKNHDGSILVDSTQGKGTTISLFLPRFKQIDTTHPRKRYSRNKLNNRILLIDDEMIIREVGQRMLEKDGFDVILAPTGAKGLKIFLEQHHTIDLILLDWMMPGMSGKITAERLKEINPDVPVCFLSGYRPCDKPEMLQTGDKFFIQKPFHAEALLKSVNNILHPGINS